LESVDEDRLGGEARLQHEPRPRLEHAGDGPQERGVALFAEVAEAVAEAERAVEGGRPGQVAHLAVLKGDGQVSARGGPAAVVEEVVCQVNAGDGKAARGQGEGESAGARGHGE